MAITNLLRVKDPRVTINTETFGAERAKQCSQDLTEDVSLSSFLS